MRTLLFSAAILACLPLVAFGQSRTGTTTSNVPCCGQTAGEESMEQMRMETQQNLQDLLKMRMGGKRLAAGDYLILESEDGYEFRALVSKAGVVDGWYVADLDGMPVALINAGGSVSTNGIAYCNIKFARDISNCAYLQHNWPNRYALCINSAYQSFFNCLSGLNGGVIMR